MSEVKCFQSLIISEVHRHTYFCQAAPVYD